MRTFRFRCVLAFTALAILTFASGCADEIEEPTAAIALVTEDALVVGGQVVLDGSGSVDAENGTDKRLEYGWSFVQIPPGSRVSFNTVDSPVVSFAPDVYGEYTVGLIVNSGNSSSDEALLVVTVIECGKEAPSVSAITFVPVSPNTGDAVQLSATVTDADNSEICGMEQDLFYEWSILRQPAGAGAELNDRRLIEPSFVALLPGTYEIALVVSDGAGMESERFTASVDILTCGYQPPVAALEVVGPVTAGPSSNVVAPNVDVGFAVALDCSASADPDAGGSCGLNVQLSYDWVFFVKPPNSTANFNDKTLRNPSFTPDEPGVYEIMLTVSDGELFDYAYLTIEADPAVFVQSAGGYAVDFVAGGPFWSNPSGMTVDDSGLIYAVQSGTELITVTDPNTGATTFFSVGGYLGGVQDIVWDSVNSVFFASVDNLDAIVQLDAFGAQTLWTDIGDVDGPRGLDLFTNSAGVQELIVMERNQDRVLFYDPSDAAFANSIGSNDFGGNLNNGWGVAGAAITGTDTYFVTDQSADELWRTDGTTDRRLFDMLDNPHGVAYATSGKLVVADSNTGVVYLIDNCGAGNCSFEMIAFGIWEPWGLEFVSATELLVTDRSGDALFRITGTF